jgi:hypothetical protein
MTTIRRTRVPGHPVVDTGGATSGAAGRPQRRDGSANPVRLALVDPPTAVLVELRPTAAPIHPPRPAFDRVAAGTASSAEATAVWDSEGGRPLL